MKKVLWCTSFRPVGVSKKNDKIQNEFIPICRSDVFDIDICAAQFGEPGVRQALEEKGLNYFHKDYTPPKGTKYSQSIILDFGLTEFIEKGDYDFFVWSTCDFTFDKSFLKDLVDSNNTDEWCNFILPQHQTNRAGLVNKLTFSFGSTSFYSN